MQSWEHFLQQQEKELGFDVVQKWLRPLKVMRFDAGNLYLEAKDHFQALWFEEHIRPKVKVQLLNNNQRLIKIHLTIASAQAGTPNRSTKYKPPKENVRTAPPPFSLILDDLDPHCTFSRFVSASENELAYKILTDFCHFDSEKQKIVPASSHLSFNPIYLHGKSGSGKTHLLMAAAAALKEQQQKIIYSRAETFTAHVVGAIRAGEMSAFRRTYRNIDALLIDDVHLFSRKGATQEELFHTFNTLHLTGKQIILAANCLPRDLEHIEPRLVSRFEWGIVAGIDSLKPQTIADILQIKSKALQSPLNPKVIQFLIESFPSGTKASIRALEALILRAHLTPSSYSIPSTALTVMKAKQYLSDLMADEEKQALTPQRIIQAVAEFYEIPQVDILGKGQNRECVLPRQVAMALCRSKLNLPYMKIGHLFSRDHSTVMTSIKQIKKNLDKGNQDLITSLQTISKKIEK